MFDVDDRITYGELLILATVWLSIFGIIVFPFTTTKDVSCSIVKDCKITVDGQEQKITKLEGKNKDLQQQVDELEEKTQYPNYSTPLMIGFMFIFFAFALYFGMKSSNEGAKLEFEKEKFEYEKSKKLEKKK